MKFQLLTAILASAAFVAAAPADADAPARPIGDDSDLVGTKRVGDYVVFSKREACGEGRPCFGVNRDDACSSHCKSACGKSYGQCGGFLFQTCQCH